MSRRIRYIASVLIMSSVAVVSVHSTAGATFAAVCPSGDACLSSTVNMDAGTLLYAQSTSLGGIPPNDQNWNSKSFGNKIVGKCATFSQATLTMAGYVLTVKATANYNSANSFGGSTVNIDKAGITSGTC